MARLRARVPRGPAIAAGLLVVLTILLPFVSFDTAVVIRREGQRLRFSVDRTLLEAELALGTVERLAIEVVDSTFPMGGRELRIDNGEGPVLVESLPRRFELGRSSAGRRPVGDWWVDARTPSATVLERELALAGDFELRAVFTGRCLQATSVNLHGLEPIRFEFRRGAINDDAYIVSPRRGVLAVAGLQESWSDRAVGALEILLRSLYAGCWIVVGFALVRAALGRASGGIRARGLFDGAVALPLAVLAATAVLFHQLWIATHLFHGLPQIPDSVAYLLEAKWLTEGLLYRPEPPFPDQTQIPFMFFHDGKWLGQYPVGWPLLLAIGEALSVPWSIAPVLGGVYVLVLFLLGREIHGPWVGLAAAALAALSPMAKLIFGSTTSHAASSTLIVVFLWLAISGWRLASPARMALGGISLGFALGVRPLTAVAVAAPFAVHLAAEWWHERRRRSAAACVGAFVAGGLAGTVPTLLHNLFISGHLATFAYAHSGGGSVSIHHLPTGIHFMDATLAATLPAVFGWGWGLLSGWPILAATLGVAFVPFLMGRATRIDGLLAGTFLALPIAHCFWDRHGLHGFGPRFYFEGFFALFLLCARAFQVLSRTGEERAAGDANRWSWSRVLAVALLAVLLLSTAWRLGERLSSYRDYNLVTGALERAVRDQGVTRALILFPRDSWQDWGEAANLLSGDPRAELVFAVHRDDDEGLRAFYSDRPWYQWSSGVLQPTGSQPANPPQAAPASTIGGEAALPSFRGFFLAVGGLVLATLALAVRCLLEARRGGTTAPGG